MLCSAPLRTGRTIPRRPKTGSLYTLSEDQSRYKNTVNLPQTDFSMRASLPETEPLILKRWDEMDLYGQMRKQAKGRPKFILHDGPPYANGEIHAGTALNKILKDLITKSKQMSGYDAPYVPGWDCHGLPIEYKVMSELGEKAKSLPQTEIRQRCRAFALSFVDKHRAGFRRLGVTGDWFRPYLTLSPEYVSTIVRVFADMYLSGVVYKGLKPIHWCPDCETALAEAEVEYANHASPSIYVKFEAESPIPGVSGKAYYVIWTTTPWTLPANRAVCLHPDYEYSAIQVGDETLIMASLLAPVALEACGITEYQVIKKFAGKDLEHLTYRHVLEPERSCPVILGGHVTLDAGTGCVHTAPGHGQEDYVVGARYGIEPFSPVDSHGVFTAEAGAFAGQRVFSANKNVIVALQAKGALLKEEKLEHSYPHCWRCNSPLIFRATPQWFINLEHEGLREKLVAAVDQVNWIPDWGKERIRSMIAQRPDWCISRQRAWGVPIPVFYGKTSGEVYATAESFKRIEELALSAQDGIDRWFDTPVSELLPEGAKCPVSGETEFVKETDILDVWFDSGVSNRAVCEKNPDLAWPADLYLEGSDQHRGWFQSSIIPAVALKGRPPYKSVVTHGYVVDGEGKKMSKKLGNVVEIPTLMTGYGADIVRLWVTCENYRQDIRLSKEILTRQQDTYRRIRNTFRYMLGNLFDFPADGAVPYEALPELDQWALHQTQQLITKMRNAFEQYEFHQVYHAALNFCAVDMSAFYLDVIKDRLYTYAQGSLERRSAQTALAEILSTLVRLLAPVLPFTCEQVWEHMPAHLRTQESVHLASFPDPDPAYCLPEEKQSRWDDLLRIRAVVSKYLEEARRSEMIGSSLQAAVELAPGQQSYVQTLAYFNDALADLFIVSKCATTEISSEAEALDDKISVRITLAPGAKCIRCWHVRETVGTVLGHPAICHVCAEQLGVECP